jgi:hypothetical protein
MEKVASPRKVLDLFWAFVSRESQELVLRAEYGRIFRSVEGQQSCSEGVLGVLESWEEVQVEDKEAKDWDVGRSS